MRNAIRFGLLVIVVAACGGVATTTTEQITTTTAVAVTTNITTAADPSSIPEGRALVTENADGTRTVEWVGGSAVVPDNPQRIVTVIGDIDLEGLLALGITPVGSGTQDGTAEGGFAPHLADLTGEVERLGWADGVPYEAIAALAPDLIFTYGEFEQLSQIAPAVPSGSWIGTEWREDFLYIADVVGQSEEAALVLSDLEARIADVSVRIEAAAAEQTVASAQVAWDHSQVFLEPADSFASSILTDLGLELATIVAGSSGDLVPLSFERIDDLDADILFWQVRQTDNGEPDQEGLDQVTASPLWATLPAVGNDSVYFVENRPWYFPTILSARRIVDDVEAALAPS